MMREKNKALYYHPDSGYVDRHHISDGSVNFQIEVMKEWFLWNFEDPADTLPFDSEERVYIPLGRTIRSRAHFKGRVEGIVEDEAIKDLVDDLQREGTLEWSAKPDVDDFSDYIVELAYQITNFQCTFLSSMQSIKELLDQNLSEPLNKSLYKLLYVNVIAAMEAYLPDVFIRSVFNNEVVKRKYIENNPDFKNTKFDLKEIYNKVELIDGIVKDALSNTIFHNLSKVKQMYKEAMNIQFPDDIAQVFKAVLNRQDIVHRDGRTKNGEQLDITKEDVGKLMASVVSFIDHLDRQLVEKGYG